MGAKHYTQKERRIVREMYNEGFTDAQIAKSLQATHPGCTATNVSQLRCRMKLTGGRPRTQEEVVELRVHGVDLRLSPADAHKLLIGMSKGGRHG